MSSYYKIGRKLMESGDLDKAFRAFCEGEENGDAKCIYGKIALFAKSRKDFSCFLPRLADAFETIIDEAENGDSDACFIIGRCYEMGLITEQNFNQAIFFYNKASQKGDTDAMFNIGCIMMHQGKCEEAMAKYFVPAAKLGNVDAINAVAHYKKHKGFTK